MKAWIKQLFCRHEYRFVCNLPTVNMLSTHTKYQSIWKCERCGKLKCMATFFDDKPRFNETGVCGQYNQGENI